MTTHLPHDAEPPVLAVIGAGPRGSAVVARLIAHLAAVPGARAEIHVVDPHPPGAGRVWDPDQSPLLLMNTLAGHATAFPDADARLTGPAAPGPSLRAWAQRRGSPLDAHAYPARALMGRYLSWAYRTTVAGAPPEVRVVHHPTRATGLARTPDGRHRITLADAPGLTADAVVLATGHTDRAPTSADAALDAHAARHGLVRLPSGHAQERDTTSLAPGGTVVVRGLAMGFFDQLALLTEGRGGRFTPLPARSGDGPDGRLRYLPSGREPRLLVTSGRGVPYLARARVGADTPPSHRPAVLDAAAVARLTAAAPGSVSFGEDVLPLILKEAGYAWYRTLAAHSPDGLDQSPEEFLAAYAAAEAGSAAEHAVVAAAVPAERNRFDAARLDRPLGGLTFPDAEALNAWVRHWLAEDLAAALTPQRSPRKAAAAAIAAVKAPVRRIAASGVLDAASVAELAEFRSFGAHVASGPPASRAAELLALAEAGVVEFLGARPAVSTGPAEAGTGCFTVRTASLPDRTVSTGALLDAWLPSADLARTADPLLAGLVRSGAARPHRAGPAGEGPPTGALDVDLADFRVRDRAGRPAADLFAFGIPLEGLEWNTAIGARAGTDAALFRQADRIAQAMLRHCAVPPAGP
ncbi:FAD/NAD(P)-binding protein [Streptomyces lonarensis]|uniref:FAD/NAD(P)-binding protein n=1 Tax=Streptomyces lonarensis TaxID=700599 RepID=A0A7X6CXP0_9ACTN|nr:FAD/NAD(P)-binding protein [Streptomyces lonarensis]NJQ04328.1 FAD/NAD(P)-binding protein [Streptomyces lonarensis]